MSSMQTTAIETSIKSNEHGEIENDGGTLNKNEENFEQHMLFQIGENDLFNEEASFSNALHSEVTEKFKVMQEMLQLLLNKDETILAATTKLNETLNEVAYLKNEIVILVHALNQERAEKWKIIHEKSKNTNMEQFMKDSWQKLRNVAISEVYEQLSQHNDENSCLKIEVKRLESELVQKSLVNLKMLHEKDKEIKEKDSMIKVKDKIILVKDKIILEKDKVEKEREKIMKEKDHAYEKTFQEKLKIIQEKETEIVKYVSEVELLRAKLALKKEHNSTKQFAMKFHEMDEKLFENNSKLVDLKNMRVKVSEFEEMKEIIRNNHEVKSLRVYFGTDD